MMFQILDISNFARSNDLGRLAKTTAIEERPKSPLLSPLLAAFLHQSQDDAKS